MTPEALLYNPPMARLAPAERKGGEMGQKPPMDADAIRRMLNRYRVTSGIGLDLDRFAPDDLPDGVPDKHEARKAMAQGIDRMAALQELLYANATWSLLIIVQAMDAGGKDSTIKHVMSGINPQGVRVTSFKAPGPHELAHGFLWRVEQAVPRRGMIGIFNRSHYEDVLVTRVHPEMLAGTGLPASLIGGETFWDDRIGDIAGFEAYLARQGTKVVKFFLNVSRDEQKARLLSRLDEPDKTWKFDAGDLAERALWPKYRAAYQAAIAGTATETAPWYVVPADRKWYMRFVVAEAIIASLESLGQQAPVVSPEDLSKLATARKTLKAE